MTVLGSKTSVYVCSATELDESVEIPEGLSVFGGLDCPAGWGWDFAAQTSWTAPSGEVPMTVVNQGGTQPHTHVEGFSVSARAGAAPGTSSIAAVIDDVDLALVRMRFTSGDGVDGAQGPTGAMGANGGNTATSVAGTSACGSTGGAGGYSAAPLPQWNGFNGLPDPDQSPFYLGGSGGLANASHSACASNEVGEPGKANTDPSATGAPNASLGSLDLSGYVPSAGASGAVGLPGGGGGGGGGNKVGNLKGGGGGGGGCGGLGGGAGMAGGSSVALVLLGGSVTFDACEASVGQAGDGGAGGTGGPGGMGGTAANGILDVLNNEQSCAGGKGGNGAPGGVGAGGTGGVAVVVATATTNDLTGLAASSPAASQAGSGVAGSTNGIAALSHQFPTQ
ncbi:MAG: hypothetical protein KBF56_02345 [Gemmatimonadaceae bacterium]|nr:hypothetical protein [Gemmatimonadaceae bacterium]